MEEVKTMEQARIRKWSVGMLAAALPLLLGGCCAPWAVVFIPDKNLELAVRQTLNQPFGCISESDLASIVELQAQDRDIQSLEGLEYCTRLTVLNLRSNLIQSIAPLTNLPNLVRVDLSGNQVRNIEAIAGWENLDELQLAGPLMEIFNWSPLVANVNAARGLGAGDTLVLPVETTFGTDETPLANFAEALQALNAANVNWIAADFVETQN
jgi:Leucine-rich repeat (LRR) protein